MTRIISLFAVLALAPALAGCLGPKAPVVPPIGLIYADYKAPVMTQYNGDGLGTKHGSATITNVTAWPIHSALSVTVDGAAVKQAAKDGQITKLKGADYEFMHILGIYSRLTVHAYGD